MTEESSEARRDPKEFLREFEQRVEELVGSLEPDRLMRLQHAVEILCRQFYLAGARDVADAAIGDFTLALERRTAELTEQLERVGLATFSALLAIDTVKGIVTGASETSLTPPAIPAQPDPEATSSRRRFWSLRRRAERGGNA